MNILLDFYSGSHGHFLEYVINTWIFKGPRVPNVFTKLGTSHGIRKNKEYMAQRVIQADHYTEFNRLNSIPDKIVRVTIDSNWANWIYQVNVLSRAGDIPIEKKIKLTPEDVRNNPSKLRNEWYSKFNLSEHGYRRPTGWAWDQQPAFEFPMESLFELSEFYNTLHRLSKFLEFTFVPDQELADLFKQFLLLNQGWNYYSQSKKILDHVLAGENINFESDAILQALVNSQLTDAVGVFDGELFDDDRYPTSTQAVWDLVQVHLDTFDSRF